MQRTATTPLLNKLKPPLCTAARGGEGGGGRCRGEGEGGTAGKGVARGVTAHPGVTAGILLTSAQRRRAARLARSREKTEQTSTPTQTAK